MKSHGLRIDKSLIVGDGFGRDNGYAHTQQLLHSARPFTALFAFSNLLALGAIDALREAGRAVPDDVSIVCFDDHPYADHLAAPMTAVAQDNLAMGRRAAEHLFARLRNKQKIPHKTLVSTRLIPRASVRDLRKEVRSHDPAPPG
jgi:LacI family transcriptional regulator